MKVRNILLTAVMAVTLFGASVESQAADWEFGVTPNSTLLGYINVFDQAFNYQFGFAEGNLATASGSFAAGPSNPLTLGPNTRLYDENIADPFWVNQTTLEANLITEFVMYQEVLGAVGETVNFNFETIVNSLPAGYSAIGFIKVLDEFAPWAPPQSEQIDLVAGSSANLNLTTASTGIIQAGFAITGAYVASSDPIAATGVQIIPEPATFSLIGLVAGGFVFIRRFFPAV